MSKFNYSIYYKMPAEWDRQISTWVSWPHNKYDWPDKFDKIPKVFVEIVYYLSIDQKVNIIFKTIQQKLNAFNHLKIRNANMKNISFFIFKTNRVWIRDYGPIFVKDKQGKKVIINWKFNAWSKYRDFKSDNKINYLIAKKTKKIIVIPKHNKKTVVLEGGAIDVNGEGILITTKECLLSKVQQRNPGFTISDYEKIFAKYLGVKKVIWLEKGIKGDDTHGHIDDVAKFVSKNKIFINDTKNKKDVNYETMLNEKYDGSMIDENKKGLARELARMNLTLNTYTQWYWKTDLLNLMNFLRLRADHHAQYEIRVYADIMLDTLKKWVPITYEAFMDYRVGGTEVSAKGKVIIQKLIKGENISMEDSGLSKREWNELMQAFDLKDKLI